MDTSDPDIVFDSRGVCNHCNRYRNELEPRWLRGEDGRLALNETAARIRREGQGREYDCVIGLSGGVDSSFLLHLAKVEMGLRPLAVHVDAGWNSELAVRNIERLVKTLEVDLFTYVVDWEEMRDIQLAFLKSSVPNQDIPQDNVFAACTLGTATQHRVRFVLNGSNISTESILPAAWGYNAMDGKHLRAIHRRFGTGKLRSFRTINLFQYHFVYPYLKRIEIVRPLNFWPYRKDLAMKLLNERYGWTYYGGKHYESRWTRFFQSYYLPTRFGYDKRRAHLSSLIVSGEISRDEAMARLREPLYDPLVIDEEKDFVARKLGITRGELDELIALPPRSHKDYPSAEREFSFIRRLVRSVARVRRLRFA